MFALQSEKYAGTLGLALRDNQKPGQAYEYGLFVFDAAENNMELLQWLGDDLEKTFVMRDTPDGNEIVWSVIDGPEGLWSSPVKQAGYIQTELGATQERQFADLVITLLLGPPLECIHPLAPLALNLFYFDTSMDPGQAAGDVNMRFTYYDAVNDLYYTRNMWLRPQSTGPVPVISDTWFEGLQ